MVENEPSQNGPAGPSDSIFSWSNLAKAAAVLVALISLLVGAVSAFTAAPESAEPPDQPVLAANIARVARDMRRLENDVDRLQAQVKALAQPSESARVSAELKGARETLEQVSTRLTALEAALLDNPAKAIALPLLDKEVRELRISSEASRSVIRADIDQVYDLMKWVFGTFLVAIVAMIGANVVSTVRGGKSGH